MAADVEAIQIYKNAKNLILMHFETEAESENFEKAYLPEFQKVFEEFLNNDAQTVIVLTLLPGQTIEVVKMESSKGEDVV